MNFLSSAFPHDFIIHKRNDYFNIRTKDGIKEIDLEEEKWRLAGRNSVRRKTQESN